MEKAALTTIYQLIPSNATVSMKTTLSIVFSFWNEEEVIPELIRRVRKALRGEEMQNDIHAYELIFVNDASTDNSLAILTKEAGAEGDLKIITMSRNWGAVPCILAGMQHAQGDAVIYMDADLQDPPELIPQMVALFRKDGVDIVHTKRLARDGESRFKLLITKMGYYVLQKVSSVEIQPEVGDFKLYSKRAAQHITALKENWPFMRGMAQWIGLKQTTIEYKREKRFAGKTKYPALGKRVRDNFLHSALISFSELPLKLASLMGVLISLGAFLFLIYTVIQKFLGHNLPGWSALMVTILFLGGLELLTIGILGLYIGSIFTETKNRPKYIIESTYGFKDESENTANQKKRARSVRTS